MSFHHKSALGSKKKVSDRRHQRPAIYSHYPATDTNQETIATIDSRRPTINSQDTTTNQTTNNNYLPTNTTNNQKRHQTTDSCLKKHEKPIIHPRKWCFIGSTKLKACERLTMPFFSLINYRWHTWTWQRHVDKPTFIDRSTNDDMSHVIVCHMTNNWRLIIPSWIYVE